MRLQANPSLLEDLILSSGKTIVVIDEIQKAPNLLDQIHRLIENNGIKFLLTGSSVRKITDGKSNLLAGRARFADLFPLVSCEIPNFDLHRYLLYGGLPETYLGKEPSADIRAYFRGFIQQEIEATAAVRKMSSFAKFLKPAAMSSGQILNFSKLSNDTAIPASSIREYYNILQDTFMGFLVPAWTKSVKRKATSKAKFYFFDIGVRNLLANIKSLEPQSDLYGQAFEHFIACELRAYISYYNKYLDLSYWQSREKIEVDFIIEDDIAIEVKTTDKVQDKHLKGLMKLQEENICKKYLLVSFDKLQRTTSGIEIMDWKSFLDKLWSQKIF